MSIVEHKQELSRGYIHARAIATAVSHFRGRREPQCLSADSLLAIRVGLGSRGQSLLAHDPRVYAVLGIFLILAARNPVANRSLLLLTEKLADLQPPPGSRQDATPRDASGETNA